MKMGFRWFGENQDTISLQKIRQIAGVDGVISTLYHTKPGEAWDLSEIQKLKHVVETAGLNLLGIESVNIHDDIKIGLPSRDTYIENYITTIKNLGSCGINLICYNFMPVFDWTRTDLAKPRLDGSTVLAYDQSIIDGLTPNNIFDHLKKSSGGHVLPGWEPERMSRIKELFELYQNLDEEKLFANLKYFLDAIMPVCEKYGVKMAIHPDDPAWSVFGLPRIVINELNLKRILQSVDNYYNGITFCTGSLGTNPNNNLPQIINNLGGERIHFAHVRNLLHTAPGKFEEAAHISKDGSFDMFAIVKALYDSGFQGVIRPDHGRTIWGETDTIPGYGLYDRALGARYLLGLWEAIEKMDNCKQG